jgi:hypothetical protein
MKLHDTIIIVRSFSFNKETIEYEKDFNYSGIGVGIYLLYFL